MLLYPGAGTFPSGSLFPGEQPATSVTFRTPTQDVYFHLVPGTRLVGVHSYGLSVWRIGGVWSQGLTPDAATVAAADRFYGGGRIHSLTADERADLIAGGYGAYISEETP